MIPKPKILIHHSISVALVVLCIFGCNTEKFKPKVESVNSSTETKVKPKSEWGIKEEVENESIGPAQLHTGDIDRSENGIYGRKLTSNFEASVKELKSKIGNETKGIVKIIACIDQRGIVMMARLDEKNTTIGDMDIQSMVGKAVVEQTFEPKVKAEDRECGILSVKFD